MKEDENRSTNRPSRRTVRKAAIAACSCAVLGPTAMTATTEHEVPEMNLARVAEVSTSFVSGHESLAAITTDVAPRSSADRRNGAYGSWPRTGPQWVEYRWSQPISTRRIEVYWFDDRRGVRLPTACRLRYWDGNRYVSVSKPVGLGVEGDRMNATTFVEVTTKRLRLEFDSRDQSSTGILQWKVLDSGKSPNFPPIVDAGPVRTVVLSGETYLTATARDDGKPNGKLACRWIKKSGPGEVTFSDAQGLTATAKFSKPGSYQIAFTANDGQATATDVVRVEVKPTPTASLARWTEPQPYSVTNPFWKDRMKALIVNWIPHCVAKIEDPNLPEGGLNNFAAAAAKLAGKDGGDHRGPVFANAWVYNTVEAMCYALMVDPQGDAEVSAAQFRIRGTLESWIPKILAAQEPDGYIQTIYTIRGLPRWSRRGDHEGYNAGYFIEAGIAHYILTDGKDRRLYDAAKKMADCWCAGIGPAPKKRWYDGHQAIEQALVRLYRFVESREGEGRGKRYLELAKFLLDARGGGGEYDQSHLPVTHQYEAVGHAVRAVYNSNAMTGVAIETGDPGYHSAALSLWDSIVNRKVYLTGGIGSGETSEGFGPDYSLPNSAYSESCADCGQLFFQHQMSLAYGDARYADGYEETLYNAVLGSFDLEGRNFTYTNPLDSEEARYDWHVCPCCVGNIPRTILMMPTWAFSAAPDGLFVNLYIGGEFRVGDVKIVQQTDYPRNGHLSLTVNPEQPKTFKLRLRIPNRTTSALYTPTPAVFGYQSLKVNGKPIKPKVVAGYAVIEREWTPGDRIELELPMEIQRVKAAGKVVANRGKVALRYGPLVYNFESEDQDLAEILSPSCVLRAEWMPNLLGGVLAIRGRFASGEPLLAVPNYARLNRGGRSVVWMRDRTKK